MKGTRTIVPVAAVLLAMFVASVALANQGDDEGQAEDAPAVEVESIPSRTEDSETFTLPDGQLETKIYPQPVNYEDEEGNWHPIGERLHETAEQTLVNGPNDFDVTLPKQIDSEPIRFEVGDQWVESRLLRKGLEGAELESGTATYEGEGNTPSFEFTGLSNGLKEGIELSGPDQANTYSYDLSASDGLEPFPAEDGSIKFRDPEDKTVVLLPAPVMSDASGVESRAVHYELGPEGEGHWKLSVIADSEWLQEPDRNFPIVIDPTITTGPPYGCVIGGHKGETGWIDCASWGRQTFLAGYTPKLTEKEDNWWRTLMNFETQAVPPTATVSAAAFRIHSGEAALNTSGVELRKVTKSWNWEGSWSRYDGAHLWTTEGGDYSESLGEVLTSKRGTGAGWWEFSVPTKTVEEEATEGNQLPVILKLIDDKVRECGKTSCTNRQVTFDSSAAKTEANRPYLSIIYSVPSSETPVAEYSFNEGAGEVAKDGSGHGHEGTLHGAKWSIEGRYGGALSFDGKSALVTVPSSRELELSRAFTLEAWAKPEEANPWSVLLAKEIPGLVSYELDGEAEHKAPGGFLFGNEEEEAAVEGTSAIPTKAWSYLSLTSDGTTLRLYVNGKLVGSTPAVYGAGGKGPLQIGGDLIWGEEDAFKGLIDNIRLYNRTLSEAELQKDESRPVGIKTPTATTEAATSLTVTGATLKGLINPNGAATTYQFEYGPTTSYGTKVPVSAESIGSGTTVVSVSKIITGLNGGANYHYRITATNSIGSTYGKDQSFTTPNPPPTVITGPSANTNTSVGTLVGTVNPNGFESTFYFEYGLTAAYGSKTPSTEPPVGSGKSPVAVSGPISNLTSNTTYHYRLVAKNQAGTTYGEDKTIIVDQIKPTMTFASTYSVATPNQYGLEVQASDSGTVHSGLRSLSLLLNGSTVASESMSCPGGTCPSTAKLSWTHAFGHALDGSDRLTVLTLDDAGNATSTAFDLPSQVVHAVAYTGNPASGGSKIADEWTQLHTHDSRLQESNETVTRGTAECWQATEGQCSFLRTESASKQFSEVSTPISKPLAISEAGALSLPGQTDFGQSVANGPINEIRQSWQVLPPGAGTTYEKLVSNNVGNETNHVSATEWIFWVDSATKLPIKESRKEGSEVPRVSYFSYDTSLLEAGELPAEFLLLPPPTREQEGCIPQGHLGGWSYNEAGLTYPDPRFNSLVNTATGPVILRPEGAAIDGYDPRAKLTANGVELLTTSPDEQALHWEVVESPNQSLETAGPNVVVISEGGTPSAVIASTSPKTMSVVDGSPHAEYDESGDEIVLQPSVGANAEVQSIVPKRKYVPCITESISEGAALVHQEAEAAGIVMSKPSGSASKTTTIGVWVNPHPALSGVAVTEKYGRCTGPSTKTVGSDGHAEWGGCPVGSSVTITAPHEVSVGGKTYVVSDSSRTISPPSYGWTMSFDYNAQASGGGEGSPPPPTPTPAKPMLGLEVATTNQEDEAEESSAYDLQVPPYLDCLGKLTRPYKSDTAVPNLFTAEGAFRFKCHPDAFLDSWFLNWHLDRWNEDERYWANRSSKSVGGRGPAITQQGPYYISTACRGNGVSLNDPTGKSWRNGGTEYGTFEKPGGVEVASPIERNAQKTFPCG